MRSPLTKPVWRKEKKMILDERNEFCDATALNTGGAGTYLLGDQIDLQVTGIAVGLDDLWVIIGVDTSAGSGGSATGQFTVASDASASIATDASATVHLQTGAIPYATLVAGYEILKARLPAAPAYERYLGILQTTGTAAFNAGKINAYLTLGVNAWKAWADASN